MPKKRTVSDEQAEREASSFWARRKIRHKARKQEKELEGIPKPKKKRTVQRVGGTRRKIYLA